MDHDCWCTEKPKKEAVNSSMFIKEYLHSPGTPVLCVSRTALNCRMQLQQIDDIVFLLQTDMTV